MVGPAGAPDRCDGVSCGLGIEVAPGDGQLWHCTMFNVDTSITHNSQNEQAGTARLRSSNWSAAAQCHAALIQRHGSVQLLVKRDHRGAAQSNVVLQRKFHTFDLAGFGLATQVPYQLRALG